MRKILLSALLVMFSGTLLAQHGTRDAFKSYIPVTLAAGTSMSARTDAVALDDTTRSVDLRGFSAAGILVVTAGNDSVACKVAYQGSDDGNTWDGVFVLIDSLTSTGTVGVTKGFPLPAKGMMYPFVRFRVYGSDAAHSANPAATIKSYVIRKY